MTEFTTQFLQKLYFNLPPLVPASVQAALEQEMEDLEREPKSVEMIENIIIRYSKELWPCIQAFEELVAEYVKQMGESLLSRKASYGLKATYEKFRRSGGTWSALYSGEAVSV
nr:hypothetical protein [Candidatus Magasanikbacteria bacterium]